jgi:hypothetical protein
MPVINKGTALSNGEQLTADKLNDLLDLATFSPTATDSVSTFVNSSGQIAVLDGGIAANKLATNAVTTTKILNANVTKAKLENMSAPLKVLGRTTAGAGAVEEVAILDEDDLVTDSATALATQQSIKAYVDASNTIGFTPSTYAGGESVTLPNGLIMKFGVATGSASQTAITITFADAFPNGIISAQATATNTSAGNGSTYDYWYQIVNQSLNTSVSIMAQGASSTPPAHNVNWMVIGY